MSTQPPLELRSAYSDGVLTIEVEGEVDMTTSERVETAIVAVSGTARLVVVDLSGVTVLDSSGLNALVRAQRQLRERGIALRLVCPVDRSIRRVIEIADLVGTLGVVESLDDAGA